MGITGASLSNAFGDKRSLYRRAFVHYLAQTVRDRVARLEKLPPALAIRTFFDQIIERSVDDEQRRGCMLVNAALELAPCDCEFQKLVAEEMVFIEAFFRRCVAAGQKDGSIVETRPAAEVAKLLLSVLLGIRVLARSRPPARGAGRCSQRGVGPTQDRCVTPGNTSPTSADIAGRHREADGVPIWETTIRPIA